MLACSSKAFSTITSATSSPPAQTSNNKIPQIVPSSQGKDARARTNAGLGEKYRNRFDDQAFHKAYFLLTSLLHICDHSLEGDQLAEPRGRTFGSTEAPVWRERPPSRRGGHRGSQPAQAGSGK